MPTGGGQYGPECEALLADLAATGVLICVIGGPRGSGFSVAFRDPLLLGALPGALRHIADSIDADLRG
jgi:hypothetical protein